MKKSDSRWWSNCIVEAVKAKIRDPSLKIIYISPFKNECFIPHFMWTDGATLYDFHADSWIRHWWQEFWFHGYIRKRPYSAYERWKKLKRWH